MSKQTIAKVQAMETNSSTDAIQLSYKLTTADILSLITKIHGILLLLPIAFLTAIVLLLIDGHHGELEVFIFCMMFLISLFGIVYVFLGQYSAFKKQYYYKDSSIEYQAKITSGGLTVSQEMDKNTTEYSWTDFVRCHETKKAFYFYFRYDKALIIKKQQFIQGTVIQLRAMIGANIARFRKYRK